MFDLGGSTKDMPIGLSRRVDTSVIPCAAPLPRQQSTSDVADSRPRATKSEGSLDSHYDAACAVVATVAERIGNDRMADVIEVLST